MQLAQDLDLFEASEAVQAAQRIVQQQHVGLVHQRAGQRQAPPLARRKRADVAPAALLEADHLQQRVDRHLADLLAEPARAADELQVLLGAQPVVQHRLFGHVADAVAHGARAAHGVVAVDGDSAGGRPVQAGDQAQQDGLARAVGGGDAEGQARARR